MRTAAPIPIYKTRQNVPPSEFYGDPLSVLSLGEDAYTFPLSDIGPTFSLVQVRIAEHARQATIAIGSCGMLADLQQIPPQYRNWRPQLHAFLNASTEKPITFLGGDSFLNARDAHVKQLPGGYYYVGFNTAPKLPPHDPLAKTNIMQITGPTPDGGIGTWNTITTSRIADEIDTRRILQSTARAVGIEGGDLHDTFASIVLSERRAEYLPPTGTVIALGVIALPPQSA